MVKPKKNPPHSPLNTWQIHANIHLLTYIFNSINSRKIVRICKIIIWTNFGGENSRINFFVLLFEHTQNWSLSPFSSKQTNWRIVSAFLWLQVCEFFNVWVSNGKNKYPIFWPSQRITLKKCTLIITYEYRLDYQWRLFEQFWQEVQMVIARNVQYESKHDWPMIRASFWIFAISFGGREIEGRIRRIMK